MFPNGHRIYQVSTFSLIRVFILVTPKASLSKKSMSVLIVPYSVGILSLFSRDKATE